jgi:hypothetical protein
MPFSFLVIHKASPFVERYFFGGDNSSTSLEICHFWCNRKDIIGPIDRLSAGQSTGLANLASKLRDKSNLKS